MLERTLRLCPGREKEPEHPSKPREMPLEPRDAPARELRLWKQQEHHQGEEDPAGQNREDRTRDTKRGEDQREQKPNGDVTHPAHAATAREPIARCSFTRSLLDERLSTAPDCTHAGPVEQFSSSDEVRRKHR